jgi:hypothetical protein
MLVSLPLEHIISYQKKMIFCTFSIFFVYDRQEKNSQSLRIFSQEFVASERDISDKICKLIIKNKRKRVL